MKKFWQFIRIPVVVGLIASVIYIVDNFLGNALVSGGSFMWVAFLSWTIFCTVSLKERIQALIGNVVGFGFGVFMFHSSSFFPGNLGPISIAGLLFVFLANGAMMFFPHFKKVWLHSLPAIFLGVALTFSGVGVGLYPDTVSHAFLQLAIILIYSLFGLLAGMVNNYYSNKWNKQEPKSDKTISSSNNK